MKKNIFCLLIISIVINSCKKTVTTLLPNLPWHVTLTDSNINKTYSFDAQTYGYGNIYFGGYPYFDCRGGSDSLHSYDISAQATSFINKTSSVIIQIGIGSFSDSAMSKKLAKGNPLIAKQNALQEIFTVGKILHLWDFANQKLFFGGFYVSEDGNTCMNNPLNPIALDFVKIISSSIWNDGSGLAKIKVTLQYNTHVQQYISGAWLPGIKHISGTMQTFFTVQ